MPPASKPSNFIAQVQVSESHIPCFCNLSPKSGRTLGYSCRLRNNNMNFCPPRTSSPSLGNSWIKFLRRFELVLQTSLLIIPAPPFWAILWVMWVQILGECERSSSAICTTGPVFNSNRYYGTVIQIHRSVLAASCSGGTWERRCILLEDNWPYSSLMRKWSNRVTSAPAASPIRA